MIRATFISSVIAAPLLFLFAAGPLAAQIPAAHAASVADRHKPAGTQCADCHGKDTNRIVPNSACLKCHESYAKLGEQTKDMHFNPHKSPHFMDPDCISCHIGHRADVNFCQDCHGPISRKK